MGAFKIQTDLDLSGFNLLNFCIQSYTDLENVPNLGLGRKLFFTGNSTDEKNLREVIWDGVEWKAAAYLDDIEAITNGEGSLGTRVKTLEDMLNVDDANDVINTWAEIQAFLDQVQEGTDLMDLLNSKFDKTGGTLSVSGYDGLTIASSTAGAAIKFKGTEATKGGYLIYAGGANWSVSDDGWATSFKLIHKGNALDELKGTFLPLTGGTITGNLFVKNTSWGGQLRLVGDNTQSGIEFYHDNTNIGRLVTYAPNKLAWYDVVSNVAHVILHSGNVGEYAALKDGSNASGTWGISVNGSALYLRARHKDVIGEENVFKPNVPYIYAVYGVPYSSEGMFPSKNYGNGVICIPRSSDGGATFLGFSSNGNIYYRTTLNTDWKTIAFTDSDITGNAATATKLKTAVSLWGNSFDGTKSLDGNITIRSQGTVSFAIADGTSVVDAIQVNSSDNLLIGQGVAKNSGDTLVYGNNIKFCYGKAGTSASTAMTITEEGNVLVGTTTGYDNTKVQINGLTHIVGYESSTPSLTSKPITGLRIGSRTTGIHSYIESSGRGNIQVMEYGDSTTAYALNLNPLGGAVNVGEGGLNVATYMQIGNSSTSAIVMKRGGYNYIWAPTAGSVISLGVGTENPASTAASLSIYSDRLIPEKGNNTVSLGTSSFRWSNVYSTLGDFSGRVLIGGATDDENYGLIAKGGVKFYDSSIVDYLIKGGDIIVKLQDTYASSFRFVYGLQIGQEQKAAFGFAGTVSNPFAFIGQNSTRWFDINSTESNFNVITKLNAGALIPTGQKMTFGADGPTMEYDADANAIKVTGNIYATGTVASGGKAEEGEGDTGGGGNANVYSDVLEGVITQEWEVGNPFQKEDVIVSLYMWNTDESRWEMVLADIGVTSENIWVTFGRPTSTTDKYMAVVMG